MRLTWGRMIDKREALYYMLGWALGRGLLPVTDRPHGAAGILGDKYWKWADAYESELADQKKAAGRAKSKLPAGELEKHNVATAEARSHLLCAVIVLDLPSAQSCAAVERHARPKPVPPVVPSSYREPDLAAELAEAESEVEEADMVFEAGLLKAERLTTKLNKLVEPPTGRYLDEYLAGGRLEDLAKYKLMAAGATFPERERKRREAEVRRYLDAHRRYKAAELEVAEAEMASKRAVLKVAEARARCSRREEVRVIQAAHHERRLRDIDIASREAAYERSGASLARREMQLAELRVALEALEDEEAAREATPIGDPVAASSANVLEGVLVDGVEAGEEDGDDGMLL